MSKKIFSIFIIILVLLGLCGTVFAKDIQEERFQICSIAMGQRRWGYRYGVRGHGRIFRGHAQEARLDFGWPDVEWHGYESSLSQGESDIFIVRPAGAVQYAADTSIWWGGAQEAGSAHWFFPAQ